MMEDNGDNIENSEPLKPEPELIIPGANFQYKSENRVTPQEATLEKYIEKDGTLWAKFTTVQDGQTLTLFQSLDILGKTLLDIEGNETNFGVKIKRSSGEVETGWAYSYSVVNKEHPESSSAMVFKPEKDKRKDTEPLKKKSSIKSVGLRGFVQLNTS